MKQITVLTYGTFDLFHIGHLRLLQRLSQMGNRLIVGISTDQFNKIKNKKSVIPFEERMEIVRNIKGVDLVIPENSWDQKKEDIIKYDVSIFAMGNDWQGQFDSLNQFCKVIYLPRTPHISTTYLKNHLTNIHKNEEFSKEYYYKFNTLRRDNGSYTTKTTL